MAFDLFPRAWSGYALISIPMYGWLPGAVSATWIAGSILVCAYLAARLVRGLSESVVIVLGTVAIFLAAVPGERAVIGPLIVIAGALAIASAASLLIGRADHE